MPWQSLYNAIYSADSADVRKPTAALLDRFEIALQINLPVDYRAFILMFGPGVLGGKYLILSPRCKDNPAFDMTNFNQSFRQSLDESIVLQNSFKDLPLVRRLVFFSRTLDNDYYGWDANSIGVQALPQAPIHQLLRLGEETDIVALSFREFVDNICRSGPMPEEASAHCSFAPAQITRGVERNASPRANRRPPSKKRRKD